jgi:hypothetical protein
MGRWSFEAGPARAGGQRVARQAEREKGRVWGGGGTRVATPFVQGICCVPCMRLRGPPWAPRRGSFPASRGREKAARIAGGSGPGVHRDWVSGVFSRRFRPQKAPVRRSDATAHRQVVLPNVSVEQRLVVPLLLRSVVLPKVSVDARVVVPLLCCQVVLPKVSVDPRVVEPSLPRIVVFPNVSREACAVVPSLRRMVVLPNVSVLERVVVPLLLRHVVLPNVSVEQRVSAMTGV